MLVESWELSDDYTQWTYRIRDGITFHDGTPLDGAAVEFDLETCQYAPLTAAAWAGVDTIESSGQDVIITNKGPSVALPRFTTERQCAYMFSPRWLGSRADVPQRKPDSPIAPDEPAVVRRRSLRVGPPEAPVSDVARDCRRGRSSHSARLHLDPAFLGLDAQVERERQQIFVRVEMVANRVDELVATTPIGSSASVAATEPASGRTRRRRAAQTMRGSATAAGG